MFVKYYNIKSNNKINYNTINNTTIQTKIINNNNFDCYYYY